jgi:hypothetical protein
MDMEALESVVISDTATFNAKKNTTLRLASRGLKVQLFLAAWEQNLTIAGDMIYREELKTYHLNYSINSLLRIDHFLDQIRDTHHPLETDFLADTNKYNLLYMLCFYVGEVMARVRGRQGEWLDYEELVALDEGHREVGNTFATSACCVFNHAQIYLPLDAIMARLFATEGPYHSVAEGAFALLPPSRLAKLRPDLPLPPPAGLDFGIDLPSDIESLSAEEHDYIKLDMPSWATNDPIKALFINQDQLIEGHRIVWAALIQANPLLFSKNYVSTCGEILYDPLGRTEPENLRLLAHLLVNLKAKKLEDPAAQAIGDALENELVRMFGREVPKAILPYPLKISTTFFQCRHLPDGMLSLSYFPVVINDEGLVRIVPARYWPLKFKQTWLAASQEKFGYPCEWTPKPKHSAPKVDAVARHPVPLPHDMDDAVPDPIHASEMEAEYADPQYRLLTIWHYMGLMLAGLLIIYLLN